MGSMRIRVFRKAISVLVGMGLLVGSGAAQITPLTRSDYEGRLEKTEASAERDPSSFDRAYSLVPAYIAAGRLAEAEQALARARALPNAVQVLLDRAEAELLMAQGDVDGGRALLLHAAESARRVDYSPELWRDVGDVRRHYRDRAGARAAYEKAFVASLASPLGQGLAGRFAGDLAAVAPRQKKPFWHAVAASLSARSRNLEDSHAAFREASLAVLVELETLHGDEAIYHIVMSRLHGSDTDMALASARRALELGGDERVVRRMIAWDLVSADRTDEAIAEFERVTRVADQFLEVAGEAYIQLAVMHEAAGRLDQAFDAWAMAASDSYLHEEWGLNHFVQLAILGDRPADALSVIKRLSGKPSFRWRAASLWLPTASLAGLAGDYDAMRAALEDGVAGAAADDAAPISAAFAALLVGPPEVATDISTGLLLAEMHRPEAVTWLNRAIEAAPENGLAHWCLALTFGKEERADAIKSLQTAKALLDGTAMAPLVTRALADLGVE